MARATYSQPSVRPKFSPSGKPGSPRASAVVLGGAGLAMVIGAGLTFTGPGMMVIGAVHWFLEFYSGVFSLVSLSIAIMVGLAATDRIVLLVRHRVLLQAVHRAFATTAMVFLCVHIILKVLEGHASVIDVAVPFLAAHKVLYIGLGTIASYLMFLVTWTGIIRGRFAGSSHPWLWRALHVSAYACWPIALEHGLNAGRPAKTWVTVSYVVCVILVVLALVVRLCISWGQRLRAPKAQTTGTIKAIGKPVPLPPPPAMMTTIDPMLDAPDPMLDVPEPMLTTAVLREAPLPAVRRRVDDDDPFGLDRRVPRRRAIESHPVDVDEALGTDPGWRSYTDSYVEEPAARSYADEPVPGVGRRRAREDGTMTGDLPRVREGRHTGEIPRVREGRHTGEIPRVREGRHTGEIPRVRDEDIRGYRPMEDADDFPESAYPDPYPTGGRRSGTGAYPTVDRSTGAYRTVRRDDDERPATAYPDPGYRRFSPDDHYTEDRYATRHDRYDDRDRYAEREEPAYGHVMPPRSTGRRALDDERPTRRSRIADDDDLITSGPLEPPVPDTPHRRTRRSLAELTSAPAEPPAPRGSAEAISDEEFWAHMRGEALR